MKAKKASDPTVLTEQPSPGNPIYNSTAAAQVLGCNVRILEDKFRKGEIKAKKRLGRWFTTHSNLLAYVTMEE